MIPTRNKGTLADSHIAKDITRTHPSPHSWVYQDAKELETLTAKLVRSTTKLWTPILDITWLLKHLHTQHKEHPLLCYMVPQAMPSLQVLFRVCKEENQPPRSLCEIPSHTSFYQASSDPICTPKRVHTKQNMYT